MEEVVLIYPLSKNVDGTQQLFIGVCVRMAWDAFSDICLLFPHLTSSPDVILAFFFQFTKGDIEAQKDKVTCARQYVWAVVVFLSSSVVCICPAPFIGCAQS